MLVISRVQVSDKGCWLSAMFIQRSDKGCWLSVVSKRVIKDP